MIQTVLPAEEKLIWIMASAAGRGHHQAPADRPGTQEQEVFV